MAPAAAPGRGVRLGQGYPRHHHPLRVMRRERGVRVPPVRWAAPPRPPDSHAGRTHLPSPSRCRGTCRWSFRSVGDRPQGQDPVEAPGQKRTHQNRARRRCERWRHLLKRTKPIPASGHRPEGGADAFPLSGYDNLALCRCLAYFSGLWRESWSCSWPGWWWRISGFAPGLSTRWHSASAPRLAPSTCPSTSARFHFFMSWRFPRSPM